MRAERGQRLVLVGPNGAGKSTLLKILAGIAPIQGGTRELGDNVRVGYFAQNRLDNLNPAHTVLEEAMEMRTANPDVTEQLARTILGGFLFRKDDVFKKVSVLSGGEKSRLALAKLLLAPPNLLLMDEPTTHLDIPSTDALINALRHYTGTLIFISHDVYFIREVARHVLHVQAGRLTPYAGDYDYYLDKSGVPPRAQARARGPDRRPVGRTSVGARGARPPPARQGRGRPENQGAETRRGGGPRRPFRAPAGGSRPPWGARKGNLRSREPPGGTDRGPGSAGDLPGARQGPGAQPRTERRRGPPPGRHRAWESAGNEVAALEMERGTGR